MVRNEIVPARRWNHAQLLIVITISYITIMRYTIMLASILLLAVVGPAQTRAHAEASFTIDLEAAPQLALPLFGPDREAEWAHGWSPVMLYTGTGRQCLYDV